MAEFKEINRVNSDVNAPVSKILDVDLNVSVGTNKPLTLPLYTSIAEGAENGMLTLNVYGVMYYLTNISYSGGTAHYYFKSSAFYGSTEIVKYIEIGSLFYSVYSL